MAVLHAGLVLLAAAALAAVGVKHLHLDCSRAAAEKGREKWGNEEMSMRSASK